MENENKTARKKQLRLLGYIGLGGLVMCLGGYFYFSSDTNEVNNKSQTPPQLIGVISQTFNDKFTQNALRENNIKTSTLEDKYHYLAAELDKKKETIEQLEKKIEQQTKRVDGLIKDKTEQLANLQENINRSSTTINIEAPYGHEIYPGNVHREEKNRIALFRQINSVSLNQHLSVIKNNLPYIPSGSFAEAVIIEGADANASVTGNNNTNPIQFRITGKVQMPNDHDFDLTGCFVTAEVYGDISSERGEVRTRNISCKLDYQTIDMPFKGHVAFMGKNGIKGVPIMRNRKIIAWAGAAGALEGFGKGAEAASTPVAGIRATAKIAGGDLFKSSLGGALSKASSTLSDYYIKRAEQYHPIIEIGAGNKVTVIFQDGLQLQYINPPISNQDLMQKGMNKQELISLSGEQNHSQFVTQGQKSITDPLPSQNVNEINHIKLDDFIQ